MIRDFLEMMNNGGKLKKNIVLMILCCIIYALAYQLLSKVLYQQEHVLLIYGFAYILTLLASMIPAFLSLRVLHDKRREKQMNLKICILPFLGIQSILYIITCDERNYGYPCLSSQRLIDACLFILYTCTAVFLLTNGRGKKCGQDIKKQFDHHMETLSICFLQLSDCWSAVYWISLFYADDVFNAGWCGII